MRIMTSGAGAHLQAGLSEVLLLQEEGGGRT